uniref:Putative serine/threonine-protein phosphatase 4 regulatory subunit 1 n=2 Tax=Anopheles triannulatus TaxID=58253 RepID=A0A2M4A2Q2_9DIPT
MVVFFASGFGSLFQAFALVTCLRTFVCVILERARDCYPRVLEHIISTQPPQVLCRDYKEILGTLDIISTDPDESVRLYLACWLHKYCASWFERDQDQQSIFSKAFPEKILQIIVRYLTDEPNVRSATFESLTFLIEKGYLDRATTIKLNIVEELVSKPINESFMDMCTNYIHLMVKIAPLVGSAKTQELLYTRFVKMCTCKINFVRKECATAFPVMCEVLGNEVFEKNLLQIFMKLCEDEIWTVRKACAEVMPFIALLCTLEKRRKVLVPAYKKFMFDSSLWVIKAALKNLGRFLATFAQLQILGLAYNNSLELSITNAADEAFQELMANSRQLTNGGSQPAPSVLQKNFESYEKRFKDSIQRHALLSLVKSDEEPWKSRSEDRINIEAYLSSVVFVEEHPSQRQSTGSTSDDGGGISKLADFYYVRHKSLSSTSSIASTSPTPSPLFRANQSYDEKNPLNRFLRYCSPLKNNFETAFANPSGGDGGEQGGGSDAFDNHGHWDSEDDNFGTNLPDLSLGDSGGGQLSGGDGGGGTSGVIFDGDNPKHVAEAAAAGSGGLDFMMDSGPGVEEDENTIDEYFNSHQYWYISPGLALDLEFIDSEGDGGGGSGSSSSKDVSNNNATTGAGAEGGGQSKGVRSSMIPSVGTGPTEEDDTRNNNLLGHTADGPTITAAGSSSSAAMVVEDNENQNDSDSSYGSINNNESDNKLIYLYEDLLSQQQTSGETAGSSAGGATAAAGPSGSATIPSSNNVSGATTSSNSTTITTTTTTVERIRAAEQLKTQIRWENEEVEWNLLEDFLHMKNVNKELCLDCAYNFPAVVLTFGEKFWPILSRYFFDLCTDVQQTVRRTMAASISKIALIIGREQATRDLVPSYTEFLLDSDDIKFEVVRTLAEFLKVIDSCEHETLMNHLGMCLQPPLQMMNWRFRELAGQQITELARMHTKIRKENCLLFLTGLALRLMLDKYDSVRKAGIDAFVECSHEFQQNDKVFEFFNKHFAFYNDWRRRQTYVIAAGKMLETDRVEVNIFRKHVFNNLLKLAGDAVPNVRIQVAKCLKETIAPHPQFANDPLVEPALQKLRQDQDCDVRGHIDGYQSMEEEMAAAAATATANAGGGSSRASVSSSAGTAEAAGGDMEQHSSSSPSSSSFSMPVSSQLSYAEVTSGYLGQAISSLLIDDGINNLLTQLQRDNEDEERDQQQQQQEDVELRSATAGSGGQEMDDEQEEECGEEAIEKPTSSMSTDDDAAYCSEMESTSSTAASTPSATHPSPLATTNSIPMREESTEGAPPGKATRNNNNNNNNQVVPSSPATNETTEPLVNGEASNNEVSTATTTTTVLSPASPSTGIPAPATATTPTPPPKAKENFFRRRSKGKK